MFVRRALDAYVDGLGARGFKLRLRLSHIEFGREPALIAALRELQGLLVGNDGGIEKLSLRVEAAQLEIIERKFGMKAEIDAGQIGGACLSFRASRFDTAPDASPHIRLVGGIDRQLHIAVRNRRTGSEERAILRLARARTGQAGG